jgi:predicted Zn-dependent protease
VGCGLALLSTACNEIGAPLRAASYGYALIVSDVVVVDTTVDSVDYFTGDTITDTVRFSWPPSALPVKIWVQDTVGLPEDMEHAITGWKHVLVYGEIAATIVSDSNGADIIVRGSQPLPAPTARPFERLGANPAACEGGTDVFVSAPDHTKLWLPIRMYVIPKYPISDTATQSCLARVTMHELGHALGLFKHSPDPADLMYTFPSVDGPSESDAATILYLYHQPSQLRPRPWTDTLPPVPTALPSSP